MLFIAFVGYLSGKITQQENTSAKENAERWVTGFASIIITLLGAGFILFLCQLTDANQKTTDGVGLVLIALMVIAALIAKWNITANTHAKYGGIDCPCNRCSRRRLRDEAMSDADLLKMSPSEVSQLFPVGQQRYARLTQPLPDADLLKMSPAEVSQLLPVSQQRYSQLTQPIAKLPRRRPITPANWAMILKGLKPLPDAELLRVPPDRFNHLFPINQQRLLQLRQSIAGPAPVSAPAPAQPATAGVSPENCL